ncbi:DEKNAAC100777 [Brettanomyces naardenensis]|uniref:DEKNAAC100777 n=1 Tax=Brettanomyces naardenensis TaxID=13370 RepID=A0A448YFP4_BRENA|nr:DEKNAAC100777 [Brettanomyces naardenensis]
MFAVPSKSSRHSGQRHGGVSFVPPSESGSKLTNPSQTTTSLGRRRKVALAPGHSAVDWEKSKGQEDLRRINPSDFPMRITKAQLKQHHTKNDCWMAFNHKVYNITNYLDYHPGGREILIENSGTDAIQLFQRYHPWVNYERILDACFIGFLV